MGEIPRSWRHDFNLLVAAAGCALILGFMIFGLVTVVMGIVHGIDNGGAHG